MKTKDRRKANALKILKRAEDALVNSTTEDGPPLDLYLIGRCLEEVAAEVKKM